MDQHKYEVHPDAALFPMMSDDELETLAADIKENGQVHPIILADFNGKTVVLDGRNRQRACEIAGVEPSFHKINGEDQKAFILSMNINRRHMSAAQRAMAVAMIYPEAAKGGRGKKNSFATKEFSQSRLSIARAVYNTAPDLAKSVIEGTKSLDDAYNEVRGREGTAANEVARLRKLRDTRPDLADRVVNSEIDLAAAETQAKQEAEARKQQRWAATKNLCDGVMLLDHDVEVRACSGISSGAIRSAAGQERVMMPRRRCMDQNATADLLERDTAIANAINHTLPRNSQLERDHFWRQPFARIKVLLLCLAFASQHIQFRSHQLIIRLSCFGGFCASA